MPARWRSSRMAPRPEGGPSKSVTETVASRKGIEPLTPGLGNLCSILLSYREMPDRFRVPGRKPDRSTRRI